MIREFRIEETNEIMEIWKDSTIKAHKFIPESYWLTNYSLVKEIYIPMSKTFVYIDKEKIKGFISIIDDTFIGAVFVDVKYQGQGVGTTLINFAKNIYSKLNLAVYKENEKSVGFYKKSGFLIESEQINEDTDKVEFIMSWSI
ncbi:N-acetyltransferase [Clostridium sediminicola]|uniref:N-acetyltransferase n=1 Tax=Clostridium sediminicola TaxID=3114879 RepID=UPI0031F1F028